jgi:catechol 2,3-dioxygenase-like lactoylglutathione lyase family enzyme
MKHFEQIKRLHLYVPDVEAALSFYQSLGLELETVQQCKTTKTTFAVLHFPGESTGLCLHDDPQRQFVDVEVWVASVNDVYQTLSQNPAIHWLQTPHKTAAGWRGGMRSPDGNVWVLVSDV